MKKKEHREEGGKKKKKAKKARMIFSSPCENTIAVSGIDQLASPSAECFVAVPQMRLAALQKLVRQLEVEVVIVSLRKISSTKYTFWVQIRMTIK